MGVKDLRSIILRHAAAAVTPYTSLSSFSHSTFAIDANLLTTKFHHVLPSSYALRRSSLSPELLTQHRHVRAWYYFLLALKRADIRPIVVFDGETRLPEKEQENIRRRQAREQQRDRGEAERKRGERLGELKAVWAEVLEEDRRAVADEFRAGVEGDRGEQVEGGERSPAANELTEHLLVLYESFQDDSRNPIYSKNQDLLTVDERAFFQRILDAQADGLSAAERASLDDLSSRSTALGLSHLKRATSVPQYAYDEIIQLVQALGIPHIQPSPSDPHEAEGLCATLVSLGFADYVVSEDTDVTVYGAPLLRQITTRRTGNGREDVENTLVGESKKRNKDGMNVLDPVRLREELGMDREMFVDLALLCGTDFTERIPGVGFANALKLIRTHGKIENILSQQTKFLPLDPAAYLATIIAARLIFLNLPPLPPSFSLDSTPISPELSGLLKKWGIFEANVAPRFARFDEGAKEVSERISLFLEGRDDGDVEEEGGEEEEWQGEGFVERKLEERDLEAEAARDARLAEMG